MWAALTPGRLDECYNVLPAWGCDVGCDALLYEAAMLAVMLSQVRLRCWL